MSYDFSNFNERTKEIEDWLKSEFALVRTGKASPLLLDSISINSFGTKTPLKHVASIAIEDARTLKVTPWEKSHIKDIESAISISNLGISTSPDATGVRVIFPELTNERRESLKKLIKTKLEDAKISLRKEREKVLTDIENQTKNKEISEDDKFTFKEALQKKVDECSLKLEKSTTLKEEEISN